ncbi:MAG: ATP-binding protein [Deltaproteobacteria bacterium]|nr:ATP-binding protein [Deltaproteobacteria bacterium]
MRTAAPKKRSSPGQPLAGLTARFSARPESLAELHTAFETFFASAERAGAAIRPVDRVAMVTAASEIAANIVDHACHHLPDAQVSLALQRTGGSIEARFEDPGAPFGEARPKAEGDEIPHMGVGLKVARASLDALEYVREDGHNCWRLVRLTAPSGVTPG